MVVFNNNTCENHSSQIWSNECEINDDGGVEGEAVDSNYHQKQPTSETSEIPKTKVYEEKYVKGLVSESKIFL